MLSQLCLCVIVKKTKQSCSDWYCNFVARLHKAFDGKARLYNCNRMQLSFDWINFIQLFIFMTRVKMHSSLNLTIDKEKTHKGYAYKLDSGQTAMVWPEPATGMGIPVTTTSAHQWSGQWSQKWRRIHSCIFLSQDLFAYTHQVNYWCIKHLYEFSWRFRCCTKTVSGF